MECASDLTEHLKKATFSDHYGNSLDRKEKVTKRRRYLKFRRRAG